MFPVISQSYVQNQSYLHRYLHTRSSTEVEFRARIIGIDETEFVKARLNHNH